MAWNEGRQLIVMPRAMPFCEIHREPMRRLAPMGAVIRPPEPGFYNQPRSVDDRVEFVVARVLAQLEIEQERMPHWGLAADVA